MTNAKQPSPKSSLRLLAPAAKNALRRSFVIWRNELLAIAPSSARFCSKDGLLVNSTDPGGKDPVNSITGATACFGPESTTTQPYEPIVIPEAPVAAEPILFDYRRRGMSLR